MPGDVDGQCQFTGWPDDFEKRLQGGAQSGDRLFWRNAVADRAHAGTEQGGGAPDTVLILLNHVGDVNDLTHVHSMARRESLAVESGYGSRSARVIHRSGPGISFGAGLD